MSWHIQGGIGEPCEVLPYAFTLFLLTSNDRVGIAFVLSHLHEVCEEQVFELAKVVNDAQEKFREPCAHIAIKGCWEVCAPKSLV